MKAISATWYKLISYQYDDAASSVMFTGSFAKTFQFCGSKRMLEQSFYCRKESWSEKGEKTLTSNKSRITIICFMQARSQSTRAYCLDYQQDCVRSNAGAQNALDDSSNLVAKKPEDSGYQIATRPTPTTPFVSSVPSVDGNSDIVPQPPLNERNLQTLSKVLQS